MTNNCVDFLMSVVIHKPKQSRQEVISTVYDRTSFLDEFVLDTKITHKSAASLFKPVPTPVVQCVEYGTERTAFVSQGIVARDR
ncbi:hypothetical protein SAMN04487948_11093 [Halogranum amylolyticum]|uniref:Uncharacterized protein n=1 Tax=Halogranum amylolyticum TaxID=660520 RepID=A0A1H8UCQ0_9EURY|nr:hypothetical protein SAMN04487948_11093 [Halogranum amylolyticum]